MEPDRCPIVTHGRGVKPFQAVRLDVLSSETCCFVDDLYRGLSGLRAPAGARMALPRSESLRPTLTYQFDSAESTRVPMMRSRTADWYAEPTCISKARRVWKECVR